MNFTYDEIGTMAVALVSTLALLYLSRSLFKPNSGAGGVTLIEGIYYLVGIAGLVLGYYFNFQFMDIPGANWWTWIESCFVNPASASAAQDLFLMNLIILPIWTIADGRRCKLPVPWLYFPMSLVTSYAFAAALFLAFRERQLRINGAG